MLELSSSFYHPRLLPKLLVYGYLSNQYSSRKIEQATKQNIYFMLLSAMNYPDATFMRMKEDHILNGQ
jgi:transposase